MKWFDDLVQTTQHAQMWNTLKAKLFNDKGELNNALLVKDLVIDPTFPDPPMLKFDAEVSPEQVFRMRLLPSLWPNIWYTCLELYLYNISPDSKMPDYVKLDGFKHLNAVASHNTAYKLKSMFPEVFYNIFEPFSEGQPLASLRI